MVHPITSSPTYSELSASVCTQSWSTSDIPINKGVFQGDPLSVIIFNTVMNTFIDAVKPHLSSSYHSPQSLGLLQYADDTCLVSDGPVSCRHLLVVTDLWLKWSGMEAKCQCMAIKAGTGKVYDPNLTLSGGNIPFVGNKPVRFLGGVIQVPTDNQEAHIKLQVKLQMYSKCQKNAPFLFRSILLVMNGQKKWRAVLPVPFHPFRPFCLLILAPAYAQMNPV